MQRLRWIPISLLSFGVAISYYGCDDGAISNPDDIVFPETNVSYAQQVQPLFNLSCNETGCHDDARPENNGLALTSWYTVRTLHGVGQPDTTCDLVRVVLGREIHSGVLRLNDNHRRGILQWVLEGAKNN